MNLDRFLKHLLWLQVYNIRLLNLKQNLRILKRITCAGNSISEYDDKIPSDLTAEEILIRSGNIGSVRIAEKIGIENYNNFFKPLELFQI